MIRYKPNFSIYEIGYKQFYFGTFIGLGYSIIFNYLFRVITLSANLPLNGNNALYIGNSESYELSSFILKLIGYSSVCFGFTFTTYLWLSKLNYSNKKINKLKRISQAKAIFILFICFLFLVRLWNFFIQNKLSLENDLGVKCYLLPTFIFIYNWNLITQILKAQKILFLMIPIILITGKILSLI